MFPEPDKWKKSWETVYRSLMPHRHNIIEDEQRAKSVSELPFSPLPHGIPGPWTAHVVKEISSQFQITPESLPPQLIVQLGICEEGWPYIFARPHGRITSACPTRRTPGRTSSGSFSRSCLVDCYLISIAHSRTRRFSGPIIPICRLPSAFCVMRS